MTIHLLKGRRVYTIKTFLLMWETEFRRELFTREESYDVDITLMSVG